jgi:DNA-binding XRE family transcriptional regulator
MATDVDNPLKEARERLMISKCELAKKAGLSLNTIHRLERGKSSRLESKRKIVKALGFNPWQNREKESSPKR